MDAVEQVVKTGDGIAKDLASASAEGKFAEVNKGIGTQVEGVENEGLRGIEITGRNRTTLDSKRRQRSRRASA